MMEAELSPVNLTLSIGDDKNRDAVSAAGASSRPKKKVNTKLYKTNLCRTFSKHGSCPYGAKCQFAHGDAELRPVPPEYDDAKKVGDALALSTPIFSLASSALSLAANEGPVSPRIMPLSLNSAGSQEPSSPSLAIASSVLFSAASASDKLQGSSPRIAMLNLGALSGQLTARSDNSESSAKPIPEGARVDCDPKLYKTELCRGFSKDGTCRYGAKCQFAHGLDELRPAPNAAQKILKLQQNPNNSTTPFASSATPRGRSGSGSPTRITRAKSEEKDPREELPSNTSQSVERKTWVSSSQAGVNTPRTVVKDARVYKTELCKKYEENGFCPYGLKCQFAHGDKELRPRMASLSGAAGFASPSAQTNKTEVSDAVDEQELQLEQNKRNESAADSDLTPRSAGPDPKLYKTELCRSFSRTGYCRYGLKCQFAHGIHELRPSPRLVNAAIRLQNIQLQLASPALSVSSGFSMLSSPSPLRDVEGNNESSTLAELAVLNDATYEPSSPKNLKGSPVIASPTNKSRQRGASGASNLDAVPIPDAGVNKNPADAGAQASGGDGSPAAAMQAFSFSSPLTPNQILGAVQANPKA